MASVNKVIVVGNLGRDPEMRTFPSGDQVANVTVATTDRWKDKQSGEMREATEWHRIVFNGRLAEIAGQYLRKGSQVYVEGSLRTRKWTDKDGIEKYTTEIRADQMQMLAPARARADRRVRATTTAATRKAAVAAAVIRRAAMAAAVVVAVTPRARPRRLRVRRPPRLARHRPSRRRASTTWMTTFRSKSEKPAFRFLNQGSLFQGRAFFAFFSPGFVASTRLIDAIEYLA